MRIRVVRNFAAYKEGQEFDWGDGMARVMIARGLIVPVDDAPQPVDDEIEEATESPQVERAVHQPRRKRR